MATISPRDLKHMATPPEGRGAAWWMREHAAAERAVATAWGLERGPMRADMFSRVIDGRLDHLALVDDTCDAIVAEVAASSPTTAECVRAHYMGGEGLRELADQNGMTSAKLYAAIKRELARLPTPYPAALPDAP